MARHVETTLYRLRDLGGALLYVGITDHFDRRMAVHRHTFWWPAVASIETIAYAHRGLALDAEEQAIRTEAPRHNKALNPAWKRPPPNWTVAICPGCQTERRVDVHGYMSNHNRTSGWCPGTGRHPKGGG